MVIIVQVSYSRNLENFKDIVSVLIEHFEIDTLDHIVFLTENKEWPSNDEEFDDYHQVIKNNVNLNLFANSNYKSINLSFATLYQWSSVPISPILFYITGEYFNTTIGKRFVQQLSSLDLSTNVWLFDFYSNSNCNPKWAVVAEPQI